MLKQTITYIDFNDVNITENLYFNITKAELVDNIHLQDRVEKMQQVFQGETRELNPVEVRELLDLVKTFMKLAYGVRSDDGKRFIKTAQVWEEFTQTAAYDAFLMSLFEDPDKATKFLVGIMPADLQGVVSEGIPKKSSLTPVENVFLPEDDGTVPEKKLEDYTREELLKLPEVTFQKLVGTDAQKMPPLVLQVAYERKTRSGGTEKERP